MDAEVPKPMALPQSDVSGLLVQRDQAVLTVTFNRPAQHNAMTWAMYDGLFAACEEADRSQSIAAMVLRGAGGKAFVSGTDIGQFAEFRDGADGVAYENRIARVVNRLEDVSVPTVAAVNGLCLGGGLAIAAACDLRVATQSARFGVPIARTLGNCLSMNSYSLIVSQLGPARALDLLLRARLLSAQDAHMAGFVSEVCGEAELNQVVSDLVRQLLSQSPLSMWATKKAIRRLRRSTLPDGDDLVRRVFGSEDFHRAVRAFGSKGEVSWLGR